MLTNLFWYAKLEKDLLVEMFWLKRHEMLYLEKRQTILEHQWYSQKKKCRYDNVLFSAGQENI